MTDHQLGGNDCAPAPIGAPDHHTTDDDYSDVEQMFEQLAATDDQTQQSRWRGRIITRCMPLADHIAYRFVGRGEPADDLIQVARLGLVKTVDRYESGKGHFMSYAVTTIIGEVRRHFRDNTWGMHVPRRLKDTHRQVRAAIDVMSQRLGRAPTAAELAAELNIDREQIAYSMGLTYAYRPMSLEAPAPNTASTHQTRAERTGAEDSHYDAVEDAMALADAIAQLPPRHQAIIKMRFCHCLTQTQIAQHVGISQVHVSRILAAALEHLRTQLSTDTPPRDDACGRRQLVHTVGIGEQLAAVGT